VLDIGYLSILECCRERIAVLRSSRNKYDDTAFLGAGGFRWFILAMSLLIWLTSFMVRLGLASAATQIGSTLASTTAVLSTLVTAFYIGYVGCNLFGGAILDRFGSRIVLILTLSLLAVSTFCFSMATSLAIGFLIQLIMGLASGIYFVALTKIVAEWFPIRERGMAFGVISVGASAGVFITNSLYPSYLAHNGWQALYRVLGVAVVGVTLLAMLLVRRGPNAVSAPKFKSRNLWLSMVRERNFLLFAIAGFGANWGTWGFAFWANALMIKGRGLSTAEAGSIAALFGLGALIAKPIYGYLSDFLLGRRKLMVIGCLLGFDIMLAVYGQLTTAASFRVVAPFLGIFAFVYAAPMNAMFSEIIDNRIVGTAGGYLVAFWQSGSIVVPPLVGLVFASTGSFALAFMTLGLGPLIGIVCMTLLDERYVIGANIELIEETPILSAIEAGSVA
jgi:MFS family permease